MLSTPAARLQPIDAVDPASLSSERAVVFVASTTGQGDPPKSMLGFWRVLLRKSIPADALSGTRIAVFGLGDSGYPKYNVVSKKLYRRLLQIGAEELWCEHGALSTKTQLQLHHVGSWPQIASPPPTCSFLGLGDDQHQQGYEGALSPWLSELWASLAKLQVPVFSSQADDPPRFHVHFTGRSAPRPQVPLRKPPGGVCVVGHRNPVDATNAWHSFQFGSGGSPPATVADAVSSFRSQDVGERVLECCRAAEAFDRLSAASFGAPAPAPEAGVPYHAGRPLLAPIVKNEASLSDLSAQSLPPVQTERADPEWQCPIGYIPTCSTL